MKTKKLKGKGTKNDNGFGATIKALAVVVVIISVISGMAAIIRPMQQQIDYLRDELKAVETRLKEDLRHHEIQYSGVVDKEILKLNEKLQMEIKAVRELLQSEISNVKGRIEFHEEFHKSGNK